MENKYFKSAGDLDDVSVGMVAGDKHFKLPGDLETDIRHFKPIGDLSDDLIPVKKQEDYFRPAGDLNDINNEITKKVNNNEDKINKLNDYLLTVVSGKKYGSVCELGVLMGAGRMVVNLEELKKMVDEGYNIVSATVINADVGLIEVEVQRYVYDKEKMERWRRF